MATDRMSKLIALAAEHPEMTIRDAIVATDRVPMTEHVIVENKIRYDERQTWLLYAACALQGIVISGQGPDHVASRAALYADAMLAETARRFGGLP